MLRALLRPNKATWLALALLLGANVTLFALGVIGFYQRQWALFHVVSMPYAQLMWMFWLAATLGADVSEGSYIPEPNALGWLLITVGTAISLAIYYFLAALASRYFHRQK